MGTPLLPPLPGESPQWQLNITPSLDFSGIADTLTTIDNGIETVKSTVALATSTRTTVLGKAQSWYSAAKSGPGNINNILTGVNGNIGSLIVETAGALSKGAVLANIGSVFADILTLATTSTTQLTVLISSSTLIDDIKKATILGHVNDLITGIGTVKDTLLGALTTLIAEPGFITTARTTIEGALTELETKVDTFTGDLAGVDIDVNHAPLEAVALGGLIAAGGALIQNPAKVLQDATNFVNSVKFKMVSASPVVGDLNVLRQTLITTLNGDFPNSPEDTGMYGAMILFTTATDMVAAMTEWAKKAVLLFGDHKGMGELITHAISNPLLSPLGTLAANTPLGDQIKNSNIGKDLPTPTMAQKFDNGTMEQIKTAMDTGFLKELISTDSPIAKFFSKPPSDTTAERKEALDKKKISLLPTDIIEPVLNKIGGKDIKDSLTGISKDISKLGKNPENKWLDMKGPEDLFSITGQQVGIVQTIVKDITGIVPKIRNSVQMVLDAVQKEADTLSNIKIPSLDEAKDELAKIPNNIGNINFDVLLLPPAEGGLKQLRMKLTEWVKPAATNAPVLVDKTAMFAIMIVMSAPSLGLGADQLSALTKQFQKN